MRFFCTLFDKNYLANFLTLNESLEITLKEFRIYAFCMDDFSFKYLKDDNIGKTVEPVSLSQLLNSFPQLKEIKNDRSIVEFYFTCSPFICSYLIEQEPEASHVTYLDADLYFFSSPEIIFREIAEASVAIIEHKFYGWGKRNLKYGKFNVGWVTFKRDTNGLSCLKSWLADCEEWCFDYYDEVNKRFGDQKYLDKWENEFENVKIISHQGANLAPWNIGQYDIELDDNQKLIVNKLPLVFYHYASFKKINDKEYTTSISRYFAKPTQIIKNDIYKFYLQKVLKNLEKINFNKSENHKGLMKKNRPQIHNYTLTKKITESLTTFRRWVFNDYIKF